MKSNCLAAILILCWGAAPLKRADADSGKPVGQDVVVNTKNTIEVTGLGTSDPKILNLTQRRALAREAATAEAEARMLNIINDRRGGAAATQHLQGARVVKTRWTNDGRCAVTLRLNKNDYEKLTGTRLPSEP